MKLDDRPVIDQLTEPLPLNHVQDVLEHMVTLIHNAEDATGNTIRSLFNEEMSSSLAILTEEDVDGDFIVERNQFVLSAAADETDRRLEAVRLFAEELEARL